MAFITDDLRTYLGAHASVSPLITTDPLHIFAEAVPKALRNAAGQVVATDSTYITLEEDGGEKDRDVGGFSGTRTSEFTISVVAPGKAAIRAIFLALDVALEIHHYQMGDFWVEHSFLDEPRDFSTTAQDGTDVYVYQMEASLEMFGRL